MDFALQALLGSVCLVGGDHLDEAKPTRLLGVRVAHDVALLDLAILLEEASNLFFGQRGVDTSDEQVGALVAALLRLDVARLGRRATVHVLAGWAVAGSLGVHTGCHGRWARHCGRARCRCHGPRGAVTCCGRARSHEARLRVDVSKWCSGTGPPRRTVVAALVVLVFHRVCCGVGCSGDGNDGGEVLFVGDKVWNFPSSGRADRRSRAFI